MKDWAVTIPEKLNLALLPTPLQPLDRISTQLKGPRIWMKRDDLTGCALSGNKIRKLEFTLARVFKNNCDTVITCGGIQSNHCRTTALLASKLGLRCILLLRGKKKPRYVANTLLDVLSGAEVHYIETKLYQTHLNSLLIEQKNKSDGAGHKSWIIPTGASDGVGIWGYINATRELHADIKRLSITASHIITATGSGGTQAGLVLGCMLSGLKYTVTGINVCDDTQYFQKKIKEDIQDWQHLYDPLKKHDITNIPINMIDGYVGDGYAKASPDIFETIRWLAQSEGILLDPVYTGKAFFGLTEEIKKGRFSKASDIVFIHTGGIHGLYAYQDSISTWLDGKP